MLCLSASVPTFQPQTAGTEVSNHKRPARMLVHIALRWRADGVRDSSMNSYARPGAGPSTATRPDAGDGIGAGLAAAGAVVITFKIRARRHGPAVVL